MATKVNDRPTAEQALQHGFLSAASIASAEKDMQLCLPEFEVKKDLLPVVPVGRACHLPAASTGNSWGIGAHHATPPMQHDDSAALANVAGPAPVKDAAPLRSEPPPIRYAVHP